MKKPIYKEANIVALATHKNNPTHRKVMFDNGEVHDFYISFFDHYVGNLERRLNTLLYCEEKENNNYIVRDLVGSYAIGYFDCGDYIIIRNIIN